MTGPADFPSVNTESLLLDWKQYAVRRHVSQAMINNMDAQVWMDRRRNTMVIQLSTYVLTEHLASDTIEFDFEREVKCSRSHHCEIHSSEPASWWQMLKRDVRWIGWLFQWRPLRLREITIPHHFLSMEHHPVHIQETRTYVQEAVYPKAHFTAQLGRPVRLTRIVED